MKRSPLAISVIALALTVPLAAQADVIVGELTGPSSYAQIGNSFAYALGTTSCNKGTIPLLWVASTPAHPVIGQNIYRIKDGRFEQIGLSWLKHGFTALQGNTCNFGCAANPNGTALGVGCSDPYGSSLNGSQSGLGPRYQVNPTTGVFPYPFANPAISNGLSRRIQVLASDVLPAQNPGAVYIGEGQYVAADDAQAGNGANNASYRLMTFAANGTASFTGSTVRELPAIMAWPTVEPNAQVVEHVANGEHYFVGFNVRSLPGGMNEYIYAVHNLNGDRALSEFSVSLPNGATAQNLTFHSVSLHSGDLWATNTTWGGTVTSNGVNWSSPDTFQTNPNGNALRWGQTFTFSFESAAPAGDVTLAFYKTSGTFTVPAFTIPTPEWETNGASASMDIDGGTNSGFTGPIQTTKFFNEPINLNLNAEQGAPWEIFWQDGNAQPGFYYSAAGQIVNLDLTSPSFPINNGFGATFGASPVTLNFGAGSTPLDVVAQMVAITATSADGYALSAANELDVIAAPGIVVEAVGSNSYHATTTPFWRVTHTGAINSPITEVQFSYAGTTLGTRAFDCDQTGMVGTFAAGNTGGTYRNGTDVSTGLVYDALNSFANFSGASNSGFIGSNQVGSDTLLVQTIRFRFAGGLFLFNAFEFDADTDNNGTTQSGAVQAGMNVTVTLANGQVLSGTLAVDPSVTNRAFVEL